MSGKRPAGAAPSPGGPRQLKQTKLNFSGSSSKRQPKKPRTEAEKSRETLTAASTATDDEAGLVKEQQPARDELSQQITPAATKRQSQDDRSHALSLTTTPNPALTSPATTTTTTSSSIPPTPTLTKTPTPPTKIRITDKTGDLFAAPRHSVLIHACNTVGSWGGGIALAFRARYPAAFAAYRAHCARHTPDQLLGTALLIPPPSPTSQSQTRKAGSGGGGAKAGGGDRDREREAAAGHYIGCLFTSRRYGRARDAPGTILRATGPAVRELMRLVVEEERRRGVGVGEVRMCRINSGLFAVPWGESKRVIEEMELDREVEVPRGVGGGVVDVVAYERE